MDTRVKTPLLRDAQGRFLKRVKEQEWNNIDQSEYSEALLLETMKRNNRAFNGLILTVLLLLAAIAFFMIAMMQPAKAQEPSQAELECRATVYITQLIQMMERNLGRRMTQEEVETQYTRFVEEYPQQIMSVVSSPNPNLLHSCKVMVLTFKDRTLVTRGTVTRRTRMGQLQD